MADEFLALRYFGIDWLAMVLTFTAIYLLGSKSKAGFPIMMCGNACWMAIGLFTGSIAMIAANLAFFLMNIRGWAKWSATESE